jgi:hypothetical protein
VGDAGSLTSSVGREPSRPVKGPGGTHGVPTQSACAHHLFLTAHPRARCPNRFARQRVCWLFLLEEAENVLSADPGPQGDQVVVGVCE